MFRTKEKESEYQLLNEVGKMLKILTANKEKKKDTQSIFHSVFSIKGICFTRN